VMRNPELLTRLAASPDPVASIVARFAIARAESRGVHYRIDAPSPDPALEGHFVMGPSRELILEHWT
jgi:aspartate oxidase